jgi:hypothetical protein
VRALDFYFSFRSVQNTNLNLIHLGFFLKKGFQKFKKKFTILYKGRGPLSFFSPAIFLHGLGPSFFLPEQPVFPRPSFPSAWSRPAQCGPCRHCLPWEVFTEELKPSTMQIFPFSLSTTEYARDQKGNRGELESASVTSCREKIPIKGANQDRFFAKIELKP